MQNILKNIEAAFLAVVVTLISIIPFSLVSVSARVAPPASPNSISVYIAISEEAQSDEYLSTHTELPEGYMNYADNKKTIFYKGSYGVYAKEPIYDTEGVLKYKTGDLVDSCDDAEISLLFTFDNLLNGKYYVKELKTPLGTQPTTDTFEVTIDGVTVPDTVLIEKMPSAAKISLIDADTNEYIKDAELKLYDSDGALVKWWKTGQDKSANGNYKDADWNVETETPDPSVPPIPPLPNLREVINEAPNSGDTNSETPDSEKDVLILSYLAAGEKYTLKDVSVPEGYVLADDITFTVDKSGKENATNIVMKVRTLEENIEKDKNNSDSNISDSDNDKAPENAKINTEIVKTEDATNIWPLVLLMLSSAAGAVFVISYRLRKN